MIYPSDVTSAASKARKVGVLFLKGGEAAIAEQYAKAWGDAASLRADNPGKDIDQLSRLIANRYLLEVTASGAASGAVAAAPFLGLISTLGSSAADLYLFGRSTARHILTLAALHDLPLEDLQQRRLTVLSSLLSDQDLKDVKSDDSEQLIDVLNNKIAQRVILKVGARLLPARAGAALPLFAGALAAATLNARIAQNISKNALKRVKLQAT
jgi:hypothetical protein